MSIAKFTEALRNKANTAITQEAQNLLDRFVTNATSAFESGPLRKAASVITQGTYEYSGRKVYLSEKFREGGERQGRTRLVLTEDDLDQIFNQYNISTNAGKPIALYAKFLSEKFASRLARHFEIYLSDGTVVEKGRLPISELLKQINPASIIAIRGLNFSHDNTLKHVASFLNYCNAFPGKSINEIQKILAGDYDRGHVYAQTTGRALISAGDLIQEENILSDIVKLYELLDEGSTSLNRLDGKYSELLARAKKDFTNKKLAMNIQLQLRRDAGKGNQDTGDISKAVRIVGFLQSLIKNSKLSRDGKRQLGTPAAVSVKEFEKSLLDLDKKLTKYSEQISKVLASSSDPGFLVNLQSSDSIKDFLGNSIARSILGKNVTTVKVNVPNQSIVKSQKFSTKVSKPSDKIKSAITNIKQDLNRAKKELTSKKSVKISGVLKQFLPPPPNLTNLQNLLNANLVEQIKQNMGSGSRRDILNLRSGRFAESAKIERLSESRQGMITAFYSYMKNPYATFSQGGRQESPRSRDPKLLIARSIREIAQQQVANRLRAVAV